MILNKEKQIHKVYKKNDYGYKLLFSTKDYYSIKNELERVENNEN